MSTLSHPPHVVEESPPSWFVQLLSRQGLAALTIGVMWFAVAVTAVWGGDMLFNSNDGNSSTLPSVVAVALFAAIGSWAGFKYGFPRQRNDAE